MDKLITILIADDSRVFRETLQFLCSTIDTIRIIGEATNGEEAIAFAAANSPDIILMDINMSPVNGFEATRRILQVNPTIKIIGVSMHTEPSYCKKMLRLGAKGYVAKEAAHAEIIEAIHEVNAGGSYIDKETSGRM